MKNISVFFSAFVFFFVLFFRWAGLDATYIGWAKNILTILFVIINSPLLLKFNLRNFKWINWLFLIWGIVAIFAAYNNQNVSFDVMRWSSRANDFIVDKTAKSMKITQIISYVIGILFFVLYFEKLNRIGKTDLFLKYLFNLMLPFIICSDINGFIYHSDGISGYQIGNKFSLLFQYFLSYHISASPFFRTKKSSKKYQDFVIDNFLFEYKNWLFYNDYGNFVLLYADFYSKR